MGDAFAAQSAPESGDDAFIAEKFGEAQGLKALPCGRLHQDLQNGGENFGGDFLLGTHCATRFVKARNGGPVGAARELIVHCGRVFEMAETGLLQVLLHGCVGAGGLAGDEFLGLTWGDTEIEDECFAGEAINVVFEMLDPVDESGAILGRNASRLMGQIRSDVAVSEDDLALVQGAFEMGLGFEAIAGVEQGAEMRINSFEGAEIAIEELADHFAEPGIVLGKAGGINGVAAGDECFFEQGDLSALAAAVNTFDGDEFSGREHVCRPV